MNIFKPGYKAGIFLFERKERLGCLSLS